MGSRANYAIVENGRVEVFYSHWGAQHIDRDFLFGLDAALDLIRSTSPVAPDQILHDGACEGSALVDWDRKLLQLWGGEDLLYDIRLREIWLQFVALAWPGWTVQWADNGIVDLADFLKVPREKILGRTESLMPFDETLVTNGPRMTQCFTTVQDENSQRDFILGHGARELLSAGPRLLELSRSIPTCAIPMESSDGPRQTMSFDLPNRRLTFSLDRGCRKVPLNEQVAKHWPGWTIQQHCRGITGHLELTGRDPQTFYGPVEPHLKAIGRMAGARDWEAIDVLRTAGALESQDGVKFLVNPQALQSHQSSMDASQRVERFLALLSEWKQKFGALA